MKTEAGSLGRRSGQDRGEDRLGHVEPTCYGRRAGEGGRRRLADRGPEATLRWGPGGGAGLGEMLRPVWDTVGVRDQGSLRRRHTRRLREPWIWRTDQWRG